jgi:hypothetical protein
MDTGLDCDAWLHRWPELESRLGQRRGTFIAEAAKRAAELGLAASAQATGRYFNLCCALGPGFEQRAENEWALAILVDSRLKSWVRLHQLMLRARQELRRRGGDLAALERTDAALLDQLDAQQRDADPDAAPLARVACDIEAVELRVLDTAFRHEYRLQDGQWQRVPLGEAPAPVRIGAQWPAPQVLAILTQAEGDGPGARLQVRQAIHGGCAGGRHPALQWLDHRGLNRYAGHEARALSWPVAAPASTPPATGLGMALAEETAPEVTLLRLPSCGVRDEGVPLGAQALQAWLYPATQWLFVLQREPGPSFQLPAAGQAAAAAASRCRIERDATPVDAKPWIRGFDDDLSEAFAAGMSKLFDAWRAGVRDATLHATPGLVTGRQTLTWGWREGAGGLAGEALMRVEGELDLGLSLELQLGGTLEVGGARCQVALRTSGQARQSQLLRRESMALPLAGVVADAVLRWSFPFELRVDPLAGDDGIVASAAGACVGAVGGELGLRPRRSGGSGWEWFVRIVADPVLAPFVVVDPVLGETRRTVALLPALALVDWSLG